MNPIEQWLSQQVPPGGTPEWETWQRQGQALGEEAIPVFLERLENGNFSEQYASLLGLRFYGYEAWGEGYGEDMIYKVRSPGKEWAYITPKGKDEKPEPPSCSV